MSPMPPETSQLSVPDCSQTGRCASAAPETAASASSAAPTNFTPRPMAFLPSIVMTPSRDITLRPVPGRERPPRGSEIELLQIAAEALDAPAGLFQVFGLGRVGDAERRPDAERRALHHRAALGVQQLGHEVLVSRKRLARRRGPADRAGAGWIDIERALRPRAFEALRLVEHRDAEVAPLLEDRIVLRDEILRPVERLDGGPLRNRGRVRGRLRLDHRHRLDQRLRPARVTDAPAGHAISLRTAVDGEGALIERGLDLGRRRELKVVVDEMLVH